MKQRSPAQFSSSPGVERGSSAVVAAYAVAGLLVAGLVAASYPAVTGALVFGAVSVPLVRRAGRAVRSVRNDRESTGGRPEATGNRTGRSRPARRRGTRR